VGAWVGVRSEHLRASEKVYLEPVVVCSKRLAE
jgi:hypothetical protein